ncbi:MAG TPA: NAD(P)/FAD-dependent oxidoreductase [Candidatus Thermoplasmatota archaeon]|nr:NAD(P)/FAD-dependent oxidoreductase [Candidatus Thermoplasmatota archaeon]
MRVTIVGGGLAGCITALELLRGPAAQGHDVTVLEREAAPYTTLCAEGLSDATITAFSAFDSRPYIAQSFEGARWAFPGTVVDVHDRGHTMARERWIPAMAEAASKAGADLRFGEKVTAARARELRAACDVLVGCDGPGSVVRAVVGGAHATSLGLQYRIEAKGEPDAWLEFFTDKRWSPEYAWVFPRGDILNVGILAAQDGRDWERLDRFAASRGLEGRVLRREAYPIGFNGTRFGAGNVALVGDAAGLTNPVTKGGMAAAVHAARLLAETLRDGPPADAGARYDALLRGHPLTDPSYAEAERILRSWSNEEFSRVLRYAPKRLDVGNGSAKVRYAPQLLATLATRPTKARDVLTLARAFGLSRKWSW